MLMAARLQIFPPLGPSSSNYSKTSKCSIHSALSVCKCKLEKPLIKIIALIVPNLPNCILQLLTTNLQNPVNTQRVDVNTFSAVRF